MAEDKQNNDPNQGQGTNIPNEMSEDGRHRRKLLKKAGKLAYTAPVLTVIPLASNAQITPPSDPGGVQRAIELGIPPGSTNR